MSLLRQRALRFAFVEFYNRFAFTYDIVSALVSRGEWRAWTRAALPFVRGKRVLEIAFGTGNLHLDLYAAGYTPVGVDLSPQMGAITRRKFRSQRPACVPRLTRADVRALPFGENSFSTLVMTFPPGFMEDHAAVAELHRVLEPGGVLLWVDAAYLFPRDAWARFLNWAFTVTGSSGPQADALAPVLRRMNTDPATPRWVWHVETIDSPMSRVHVFVGEKNDHRGSPGHARLLGNF